MPQAYEGSIGGATDYLTTGAQGDDVKWIQSQLNLAGYNLDVDGKLGPLTTAALTDFQTKQGLAADAIVGPLTGGALGAVKAAPLPTELPRQALGGRAEDYETLAKGVGVATTPVPTTAARLPEMGAVPTVTPQVTPPTTTWTPPVPTLAQAGAKLEQREPTLVPKLQAQITPPVVTPPVTPPITPPVVTPPVVTSPTTPPVTPPVVTPPVTTPPVTPPVVTPPVVTPPVVTPPVTPPVVTPPVTPPVVTPQTPYGQTAADILKQAQGLIGQPVDYTQLPQYQATMKAAETQGKRAAQMAAEYLNARGILNSTITRDQVAAAYQDAMFQVLPKLFEQAYGVRQDEIRNLLSVFSGYTGLQEQQAAAEQRQVDAQTAAATAQLKAQETEIQRAWDRTSTRGYVDNKDSIILGVAPGTPSEKARTAKEEREAELQRTRETQAAQTERARIQAAATNTPEKQYRNQAYQKLLNGEPLTADEKMLLGLNKTTAVVSPEATQSAMQAIVDALQQGTTIYNVEANVLSNVPAMLEQGVDLKQIYDYLAQLKTNPPRYPVNPTTTPQS